MPYPHMPTTASPTGATFRSTIATFVAVGGETDINVPIGATMADTNYAVTFAYAGGTSGDGTQTSGIDPPDLPIAGRTTTQFRAVFGQALAAGDRIQFVVTGNVAG